MLEDNIPRCPWMRCAHLRKLPCGLTGTIEQPRPTETHMPVCAPTITAGRPERDLTALSLPTEERSAPCPATVTISAFPTTHGAPVSSAKISAGAPCTHQFLGTLTVQTTKINPTLTPTTRSATSLTNTHPLLGTPSDAQQAIDRFGSISLTALFAVWASAREWLGCEQPGQPPTQLAGLDPSWTQSITQKSRSVVPPPQRLKIAFE